MLIGSAVFAQMTAECPYTSQWHAPFAIQNCPFPWWDLDPLLNRWFPGPTRVRNPDGISVGLAVFAELTSVTNRQTVGPRPHLRMYSTGNMA